MIKALQKVGIEGPYLSIIKTTCDKPTTYITIDVAYIAALSR